MNSSILLPCKSYLNITPVTMYKIMNLLRHTQSEMLGCICCYCNSSSDGIKIVLVQQYFCMQKQDQSAFLSSIMKLSVPVGLDEYSSSLWTFPMRTDTVRLQWDAPPPLCTPKWQGNVHHILCLQLKHQKLRVGSCTDKVLELFQLSLCKRPFWMQS